METQPMLYYSLVSGMTFKEAEARLLAIDPGKWDLSLERLTRVCAHLGDPHLSYPVILVGGSNGKGSVVAFLTSVLAAPEEPIEGADFAGGSMERDVHVEDVATKEHHEIERMCRSAESPEIEAAKAFFVSKGAMPIKVGSFLKPHLLSICERVRVNGDPISEDEFAAAASEAFNACEKSNTRLTFFELTFLIAAIHFRTAGADLGIFEVGLGGRFDAVNVCKPFLSVISNVGADHEQYLGETAEKQAFEKAGIIPAGGITVWGGQVVRGTGDKARGEIVKAAGAIIEKAANEKNSALVQVRRSFAHVRYDYAFDRQKVAIIMNDLAALYGRPVMENERVFSTDQLGTYQCPNLDCTYFALFAMKALGFVPGEHRFRTGLYNTNYRGRFEVMWKRRLRVILDAAHNADGLRKLRKSLVMYLGPAVQFEDERIRMPVIFSCQQGKDVPALFKEIAPVASGAFAISVPVLKPMPAEEIAEALREMGVQASSPKSVKDAIAAAERSAGANSTLLVCGSVYSLGEVIMELTRRGYRRKAD